MNTNVSDWNIGQKDLPVIVYGGEKAACNEIFDTRNKFVRLVKCYDFPPVFTIESLDGSLTLDRCFPFSYRLATPMEVERLINPDSNI